ncbi:hypothetical protein [Aquimarina rhabdastrellae]
MSKVNEKIKDILNNYVSEYSSTIAQLSLESLFEASIHFLKSAYNMDYHSITKNEDVEKVIILKNETLKNKKAIELFTKAKNISINEDEIIEALVNDLKESYREVKSQIKDKQQYKNQIIFLEHDYEPYSLLCGYGEGDYPILNKPTYFDYNYQEEIYAGIGSINYNEIWKNAIVLNEYLEEIGVLDTIEFTELYYQIKDMHVYKTYQLLHEAFSRIDLESLFEGIDIKTPLSIYANEHDCEPVIIYRYE